MAAEGGGAISYNFTGEEGEVIPLDATHFIAHESVTVIRRALFYEHPNIVELICHAGVERIELYAFYKCPCLRRVIIPGVKVVERAAFCDCEAVTYVDCPKLEKIEKGAFSGCKSLSSINLPSAKVVEEMAFGFCDTMTDAKFGKKLESVKGMAFFSCVSLKRITIPLKDGLITGDNIFHGCKLLNHVDLVDGVVLRETIDALQLEEWKNDMTGIIDSINHTLSNAHRAPGGIVYIEGVGETATAIREWISRVLRNIIHYKEEHHRLLNGVIASTLVRALPIPKEIVMNNVLPFLELPKHAFEGEMRTTALQMKG